ncbi:hypothetical protein GIB67_002678 [Kingdonia uniflora]|uniref:Uncharacterized protein n=1 Tax=Kingdonia uniflora TaxID=39325 RepID=A0A7J7LJW5_9MAGN|nr:hypothetical protein GIB67_002678 [Kingdonia uniflora]
MGPEINSDISFPAVLNWVVRLETCEEAKRNLTSYACEDNSAALTPPMALDIIVTVIHVTRIILISSMGAKILMSARLKKNLARKLVLTRWGISAALAHRVMMT